MNLADPDERDAWCAYLGEIFTGRLVIAGLAPLPGFTDSVALLRAVGARKPLLIATGPGAGPGPSPDEAEIVSIDAGRFESMTEELRHHDGLAHNLPDPVREAIEAYDPHGRAVAMMGPFVTNDPILGRPVFGGRPASWAALEDKLVAEEIWREVGYPHAPSRVVGVHPEELRKASAELDEGAGAVWSGDARDGFNGGGDFVRWVTTPQEQREAIEFFAPRCDRVRVMPFLDGVPCSIHGIVLPDGTAAFRPVELAILRGPSRRFVYGGQGTHWDPPAPDREQMRDLVRWTGARLRERADYRGAFGIDGIMTADGFRPTELNTRMSGGLTTLARGFSVTAMNLLQFNCVAGRDPRVRVEELESWALSAMDERRICKAIAISDRRTVDDSHDISVTWDGTRLTRCADGSGLSLLIGPGSIGSFAKLSGDVMQRGDRVATLNVALMRLLDEEFDTGFGAVEAAPDVRDPDSSAANVGASSGMTADDS